MAEKTRILIVDDEEIVRLCLVRTLAGKHCNVEVVGNGHEALALMGREPFDVVLLDVRMPGIGGLAVLERLVADGVDLPVIMLTGHGTVEMCRRAFKGGAAEFLEKPVDDDRLVEALQQAVRAHVRSRERRGADGAVAARYAQLSPREREVLGLIVAGLTNKEIGRALDVSPRTVETHRANLFAKLQAESLAQLIRGYAVLVEDQAP